MFPPSYAGNWPPLLIPNGAMDGSNGRESQSSAAISFREGTKLISETLAESGCWIGGYVGVLLLLVLLSHEACGAIDDRDVGPRLLLLFLIFFEATKLRRRRDTCMSRRVA